MSKPSETPYWWQGMPAAPEETSAPALPARADVVIVGAGITGLHAAIRLARAGRSVVLLEAGRLGSGASSRNNGMIVPYLRKTPSALASAFGKDRAERITQSAANAFQFIQEFIAENRIDCDLEPNERILLGRSVEQFAHLRELIEDYDHAGVVTGFAPLSASELAQATRLTGYAGAIITRSMPSLHPGKYSHGLIGLARAAGAQLVPKTRATGIRGESGAWTVQTTRGPVAAGSVAIATDGHSGELMPWLQRRVIPVTAYMAATAPLDPALMARRFPTARSFTTSSRDLLWFRSSPDGTRILFGGRTGRPEGGLPRKAELIRAEAASVLPELGRAEISHCWEGNMSFTFDGVPHLGTIEGVHYSLGYCGAGLAMGSWLGSRMGARMLGENAAISGFDEAAFPGRWFYRRSPWFVPWMMRSMRLRDRIDRLRERKAP